MHTFLDSFYDIEPIAMKIIKILNLAKIQNVTQVLISWHENCSEV